MSTRTANANSDPLSVLPFLAVLLCTMGALLVLLVTLAQRGAEVPIVIGPIAAAPTLELIAPSQPQVEKPSVDLAKQAAMQKELDEIAAFQKQLDELKAEGAKRLADEQARLSHTEEHTRRLEEELAKLSIAHEQLKQTEGDQSVDQKQAEEELARLEQLVIDTEKQLEALRDAPPTKKSYAIIPYRGQNGTYRKPIYIECTDKAIIIHPEGTRLTAQDFIAPNWPGNPLAAVLRASREYLNDKAAKAGEPEPPDPYPLIIVRPSGITAYIRARAAIASWDSDYGYEFVDEGMKLAFPEAADPQLAQVQNHALMISRDRLKHLVQSAPSRFPGVRVGSGSPYGGSGGGGAAGFGTGGAGEGDSFGDGSEEYGGSEESRQAGGGFGDGQGEQQLAGTGSAAQSEPQFGAMDGETGAGITGGGENGNATSEGEGTGNAGGQETTEGAESLVGSRYAQQQGGTNTASGSPVNAPSEPLNGKDEPKGNQQAASGASSGSSSGSPGGGQGAMSGGTPGTSFSANQSTETIAASRGTNWAVNQPRQKTMAIRRSIRVVVRENKMLLMANKNVRDGVEAVGQEISLDQPINEISDEFAAAIKEWIDDWGLAGSGMYWKPVLMLNVEPGAHMTATRIQYLLKDSGVEVQLPETAQSSSSYPGGTVR